MNPRDEDGVGPKAEVNGADAGVNRAWHDASDELPPPALDAAILTAARSTCAPVNVNARHSRTFVRWQSLAVAASVAGLAFVLVPALQRVPEVPAPAALESKEKAEQASDAGAVAVPAPLPLPEAKSPAVTPEPPPMSAATEAPVAPPRERMRLQEETAERAIGERAAPVPVAPSAVPPPPRAADVSANGAVAAAAAPAAMAQASADAQLRPDPDAWAARIAALHESGDLEGAATSLRNFRAAYHKADDYLPPMLRAWARTIE
jgi:cytoskeletal protein RodZ